MTLKKRAIRLTLHDFNMAMDLAWRTFLQFEAPEYSELGIMNFYQFIHDDVIKKLMIMGEFVMWGIYEEGELVAMSALRSNNHISLLFVDERHHYQGNARLLVNTMITYCQMEGFNKVTVNAAPYAVGFYHKIGFVDLGPEQAKDGIRFTPMKIEV